MSSQDPRVNHDDPVKLKVRAGQVSHTHERILKHQVWQEPSYPSNCLHFLRNNAHHTGPKDANHEVPSKPLNVIIVGAGICGLATAIALARNHSTVTIYEQAHQLAEACTFNPQFSN